MAAAKSFKPRFVRPPKNAEPPEWYEVGGFCPVRLNQCLADRYRVLRKLGWGTCGTVWLARDNKSKQYVALKIGASTGCRLEQEAELLRKLNDTPLASGKESINTQRLLDAFHHSSPNGVHQVLVLEPLGRSLERRIQIQSVKPKLVGAAYLREFTTQVLVGLGHVHSSGLVHRDIQPGNILFALQEKLDTCSESQLRQDEASSDDVLKLERLDQAALDEHTPPYLVNPSPLGDDSVFQVPVKDLRLVVTDFGAAATFEDVNDGYHAYPLSLRPPELVLGVPMTAPQADIWSLGCLIYQAATSRRLFNVDIMGTTREEQDDEYLQSITEVLGALPRSFLDLWERRAGFVDENGTLLEAIVEEGISQPLADLVAMYKPQDMDEDEVNTFVEFLGSMLRVEPTERWLTPELLQHPWLHPSS